MGLSWQEYWNGLPSPIPGYVPNPGIKPSSLASPALAGRFFPTALEPGLGPQKPHTYHMDSPDLLSIPGPNPREKDHQPVPWVDSQTSLLTAPGDLVPHQNPRHLQQSLPLHIGCPHHGQDYREGCSVLHWLRNQQKEEQLKTTWSCSARKMFSKLPERATVTSGQSPLATRALI